MSTSTGDSATTPDSDGIQPLRDDDTSIEADAAIDPAQAEWDRTTALDAGADPADLEAATSTGAYPAGIPDDDQIPVFDLPADAMLPDTQGESPIEAELGENGQGDLAPEDL